MKLARDLIAYLSRLEVSQGRLAGESLTVWPWQARFIRGGFRPGVADAALSVGRANGKTTILSGIASATLDGPLMVPRGETILCASSFEQARIAFDHILAFMGPKLKDRTRWRLWDTAQRAQILNRDTGARVRCIGSDPRRAHGLAPVLVLADEPAQWPPATGEKMVAALRTAAGKQPHSRFVALGTRPAGAEHWFAKLLAGGADYAQTHAARKGDPPFQKRTWQRANPSLPYLPDLEAAIRAEAKGARRDPSLLASFEALRLNLGTDDTEVEHLIGADLWREIEGDADMTGPVVWGIDLGTSAAQSAVAGYWPDTGALACLAAFPCLPSLDDRGRRDGVAGLYRECARRGELVTLGQRATDVPALLALALARFGRPSRVVADRWREAELRDALDRAGIPPRAKFEVRGMGYHDGGADVRAFRRACADGRVTPAPSLLLRSAMSEARTVTDPAGNSKLSKATQGGRRLRARDDAAAAAILAVAAGVRSPAKPARRWRYRGAA